MIFFLSGLLIRIYECIKTVSGDVFKGKFFCCICFHVYESRLEQNTLHGSFKNTQVLQYDGTLITDALCAVPTLHSLKYSCTEKLPAKKSICTEGEMRCSELLVLS